MCSPVKRRRTSSNVNVWEVESNRQVAIWRQQLPQVRVLVSSYFLFEASKKHGINLEEIKKQDYRELGCIPAYKNTLKEVEMRMNHWDETIKMLEPIVHATALVEAAEKSGVIIKSVAEDPLSLYMVKRSKSADVGVQVKEDCPICTSFIGDVEEVSGF